MMSCRAMRWIGASVVMNAAFLVAFVGLPRAAVAQTDSREGENVEAKPLEVLISTTIIQVELKDGVSPEVFFRPKDADVDETPSDNEKQVLRKLDILHSDVADYIESLQQFGNAKVLANPRVLVLNKQRMEIHLGSRLMRAAENTEPAAATPVPSDSIGELQVRVRPFVSSEERIRLEIHFHHDQLTGKPDEHQCTECTCNVMLSGGQMVVVSGGEFIDVSGACELQMPASKESGQRVLLLAFTPRVRTPEETPKTLASNRTTAQVAPAP